MGASSRSVRDLSTAQATTTTEVTAGNAVLADIETALNSILTELETLNAFFVAIKSAGGDQIDVKVIP